MVRAGRDIALDSIDWAKLIRPGELVAWGQASAEPVTLVASLLENRASIGGFRAFVGISNSTHVDTRYSDHVTYSSYCGTAGNSRLGEQLNILPISYGQLAQVLGSESPVVILSLAEGRDSAHFSYGAGGVITSVTSSIARASSLPKLAINRRVQAVARICGVTKSISSCARTPCRRRRSRCGWVRQNFR